MIIDHKDNLKLTDDEAAKYANELGSLRYLLRGLEFLCDQVFGLETTVNEALGKGKQVFIFGNHPLLKSVPQDLIACAFHWYAVTACNYVRMVGWLANQEDSAKAIEYLKRVVPAVYVWRNKVGAHFARTSPRKDDTPADLAKNVMFPISFDDDAFYAGSLTLALGKGGKSSTSREDMRWSLTHTHSELIRRYRP